MTDLQKFVVFAAVLISSTLYLAWRLFAQPQKKFDPAKAARCFARKFYPELGKSDDYTEDGA